MAEGYSRPPSVYKTKLCVLYQSSRCLRPSCTFAHGEHELRNPGARALPDPDDHFERSSRWQASPERSERHHDGDRGRGDRARSSSPVGRHDSASKSGVRRYVSGENKGNDWHPREQKRLKADFDLNPTSGNGSAARTLPENGGIISSSDLQTEVNYLNVEIADLKSNQKQLQETLDRKNRANSALSAKAAELERLVTVAKESNEDILSKLKRMTKMQMRIAKAQDELKRYQSKLLKLVEDCECDGQLAAYEETLKSEERSFRDFGSDADDRNNHGNDVGNRKDYRSRHLSVVPSGLMMEQDNHKDEEEYIALTL